MVFHACHGGGFGVGASGDVGGAAGGEAEAALDALDVGVVYEQRRRRGGPALPRVRARHRQAGREDGAGGVGVDSEMLLGEGEGVGRARIDRERGGGMRDCEAPVTVVLGGRG